MTLSSRFALVSALLSIALVGCAKESQGNTSAGSPAETTRSADTAAGTAGTAGTEITAPKVAIGANRVENLAPMASKVLAETEEFVLAVKTPDDAKAGTKNRLVVALTPQKGWKINQEFPGTWLKLTPPEGVTVNDTNQTKDEAAKFGEKQVEWAVEFEAASAGEKSFVGKVNFAVCTETTCNPRVRDLAWAVAVK